MPTLLGNSAIFRHEGTSINIFVRPSGLKYRSLSANRFRERSIRSSYLNYLLSLKVVWTYFYKTLLIKIKILSFARIFEKRQDNLKLCIYVSLTLLDIHHCEN